MNYVTDQIFVIKQGENPGLFEVCVVCFIKKIFWKGVSWGGEQEVVGVSMILHI